MQNLATYGMLTYTILSALALASAGLAAAFPQVKAFTMCAHLFGIFAFDIMKALALFGVKGAQAAPLLVLLVAGLSLGSSGCGSKTPSVPQQADVAAYTAALQACIGTAKATDGGFLSYEACRDRTDKQFGRTPEDGGAP